MNAYSSFSIVWEKESDPFGETKIFRMIITKATPTIVRRFPVRKFRVQSCVGKYKTSLLPERFRRPDDRAF